MRSLIVLRGAPGVGKTTWIRKNHLEEYTLCLDTIRYMMISPRMNHKAGYFDVSFKYDTKAWQVLFQLLEERMKDGELTIVDAVHSRLLTFLYINLLLKNFVIVFFVLIFQIFL